MPSLGLSAHTRTNLVFRYHLFPGYGQGLVRNMHVAGLVLVHVSRQPQNWFCFLYLSHQNIKEMIAWTPVVLLKTFYQNLKMVLVPNHYSRWLQSI